MMRFDCCSVMDPCNPYFEEGSTISIKPVNMNELTACPTLGTNTYYQIITQSFNITLGNTTLGNTTLGNTTLGNTTDQSIAYTNVKFFFNTTSFVMSCAENQFMYSFRSVYDLAPKLTPLLTVLIRENANGVDLTSDTDVLVLGVTPISSNDTSIQRLHALFSYLVMDVTPKNPLDSMDVTPKNPLDSMDVTPKNPLDSMDVANRIGNKIQKIILAKYANQFVSDLCGWMRPISMIELQSMSHYGRMSFEEPVALLTVHCDKKQFTRWIPRKISVYVDGSIIMHKKTQQVSAFQLADIDIRLSLYRSIPVILLGTKRGSVVIRMPLPPVGNKPPLTKALRQNSTSPTDPPFNQSNTTNPVGHPPTEPVGHPPTKPVGATKTDLHTIYSTLCNFKAHLEKSTE